MTGVRILQMTAAMALVTSLSGLATWLGALLLRQQNAIQVIPYVVVAAWVATMTAWTAAAVEQRLSNWLRILCTVVAFPFTRANPSIQWLVFVPLAGEPAHLDDWILLELPLLYVIGTVGAAYGLARWSGRPAKPLVLAVLFITLVGTACGQILFWFLTPDRSAWGARTATFVVSHALLLGSGVSALLHVWMKLMKERKRA